MRRLLSEAERAQTYDEYVYYKTQLEALPGIRFAEIFGFKMGVISEEEWHIPNLEGEYFWDPIKAIEETTIPVLAIFGEMDTQVDPHQGAQAYQDALQPAGNQNFHVEIFPKSDHNIILSETGCLEERENRMPIEWANYAPECLNLLEDWLRKIRGLLH